MITKTTLDMLTETGVSVKTQKYIEDGGVEYAVGQVEELVREGCPGIHFYVLNKSRATAHILRELVEVGSGLGRTGGVLRPVALSAHMSPFPPVVVG